METLVENVCQNEAVDENRGYEKIISTMTSMITASDNESYNEMVRLQSSERSFTQGCLLVNAYMQEEGFEETGICHTLSPSNAESEATENKKNYTSVEDCGALLEAIYSGTCVSRAASAEILELLLQQQNQDKIPSGVPEGIQVANKTGETDETQHDVAIVYGTRTDYILCVMSSEIDGEGEAITAIGEVSAKVYEYLNEED